MCLSLLSSNSTERAKPIPISKAKNEDNPEGNIVVVDDEYDEHGIHEHDIHIHEINAKKLFHDLRNFDWSQVKWEAVIFFSTLHMLAFMGAFGVLTGKVALQTILWTVGLILFTGFGVTMGGHRLWAHRCYKANAFLRTILMLGHTMAGQLDLIYWVLDHRVHHKYPDTDADPSNINRGFLFAHFGFAMLKTHPARTKARELFDMSDMYSDPVAKFQHYFYAPLLVIFGFVLPTVVPIYFWNETLFNAITCAVAIRMVYIYHVTFSIGSFAHTNGARPYDKAKRGTDHSVLARLSMGEGYHNYHHVFPYDYRTSEFGSFSKNPTTKLIDLCAKMGLAWHMKIASNDLIEARMKRTGNPAERIRAKDA